MKKHLSIVLVTLVAGLGWFVTSQQQGSAKRAPAGATSGRFALLDKSAPAPAASASAPIGTKIR